MLNLSIPGKRRILCLGAHSDDIEIGCSGTMLTLVKGCEEADVLWVVFSAEGARIREARSSARAILAEARSFDIRLESFKGSFFPFQGEQIKHYFETLKPFRPDVVFTHQRDDRHQDHRVIADLTWNTFRDNLILEYEIPKYDGDLGLPNVFVPLTERIARRKARNLCRFFKSQTGKHWFSEDTFLGLMRIRGVECASRTGFAEAFYGRKLVLGCE